MTPQEKLRKAASLVSEVCKGLEVESRACRCCERVTFPNWPAKVVSDKLATVAGAVDRFEAGGARRVEGVVHHRFQHFHKLRVLL